MKNEYDVKKSRIPSSFQPAAWRCTLPIDHATDRIGVGFTLPDGAVVRLSLDKQSAEHLVCTISEQLGPYPKDGIRTK